MNDVFQTGRRDGRMPFRVPEGFFDELPRRTVLRLRAETRRRRRRLIVRVAAVAVPFAACLAVAIVFRVSDGKDRESVAFGSDGTEQFDCYLQGLSDEELKNLAAEASLDPTFY